MKEDLLVLGGSSAHPCKPLDNHKTISNKWTIKQVSLLKGPNNQLFIHKLYTFVAFQEENAFTLHPRLYKEIQQQAPSR